MHGVVRKRSTKRLEDTGNLFRKNLQLKGLLILVLKAFRSQVKGKHSIGRGFQSTCTRKKSVDIEIRKLNQLSQFR